MYKYRKKLIVVEVLIPQALQRNLDLKIGS